MGWTDVSSSSQETKDRLEYLTFPEGTTIIRIVDDEPHSRWAHWLQSIKRHITCPGTNKNCPVCEVIAQAKANKEKPKYTSRKLHTIHVINRNTGQLMLLEQGKTFFETLLAIKEDIEKDEHGKPTGKTINDFDLKVIRKGTERDNTTYTILPGKEYKLSAEDQALLENKMDLDKYLAPLDNDKIMQILQGKSLAEIFASETTDTKPASDEEDEDVDFTK